MPEAESTEFWSVVVMEPPRGLYHYVVGQPMGLPTLKENAVTFCGKDPAQIEGAAEAWGSVPPNLQPCDDCRAVS